MNDKSKENWTVLAYAVITPSTICGGLFFGWLVFGLGIPETSTWWFFSPIIATACAIPAIILLIMKYYLISLIFQIIPLIYFAFGLLLNYLSTGSFFGGHYMRW